MHSLFRHEYKSMQKRSHPCDGCLCSESKVARLIETECYYTAVLLHGDRTRGLYLNCSSFQTVTGLSYIIQHRLCFVFLFGGVRRGLSTPAVVPQQRCWKMLALCSSGCDVTPPGNVKHWLDFHPSSLRSASSFFSVYPSRSREWRQDVWDLLLNSCCNSGLNWATARWSHDMESCP